MKINAKLHPALVFVCSPFRASKEGSTEQHIAIAQRMCRWVLLRGDAPLAPHLFYPVNNLLDDDMPGERETAQWLNQRWLLACDYVAAWKGAVSEGMQEVLDFAEEAKLKVVWISEAELKWHNL